MSEMIDRAAEIIEAMVRERMKSTKPEDNMNYRRAFTPIARAAIEAMRVPTLAMVNAAMLPASDADRETYGPQHWIWEKMIDEALK